MLAARLAGCDDICSRDIAAAPLAFATKLGADSTIDLSAGADELKTIAAQKPWDVAFEISGTAAGLGSAIASVRRGGTVVQVGNLPGGQIAAPLNAVMAKEIDLNGTFRFGTEFSQAVDLIVREQIDVLSLVTAELPLSSAEVAFRLAADRSRSIKVVLTAE